MSKVKYHHPLASFDSRCEWCKRNMAHTQWEHDQSIAKSEQQKQPQQPKGEPDDPVQ